MLMFFFLLIQPCVSENKLCQINPYFFQRREGSTSGFDMVLKNSRLSKAAKCFIVALQTSSRMVRMVERWLTIFYRAFVQDWHFINTCQVNRPFNILFFLPCVQESLAFFAIQVCSEFLYYLSPSHLSLLFCKFTCNTFL